MNLRNFIGRQLEIPESFEYQYNSFSEELFPRCMIYLRKGEGAWYDPTYCLWIRVTESGQIMSIMRLTNHREVPFPVEIELEAERLLEAITTGTPRPMGNYKISGKKWEDFLKKRYCGNNYFVLPQIFTSKLFETEGENLVWSISTKGAEKVKLFFDQEKIRLIKIECPENIKIGLEVNERFCGSLVEYLRKEDVVKPRDYSMTGFEEWLSGSDSYYPVELMDMMKRNRKAIDEKMPLLLERLDSIYNKNPIVWVDWLYCTAQGIGIDDLDNEFWNYLASNQNNLESVSFDFSFDSRYQYKELLLEMIEKRRYNH